MEVQVFSSAPSQRDLRMPIDQVNSKTMPTNFPRDFDAHVYFTIEQLALATALQQRMKNHFLNKNVYVGSLISRPIGPHGLPMFEANFPENIFGEVVRWLMHARGELSVLVHELAGDDTRDHTQGALWLGPQVPLNFSVFK